MSMQAIESVGSSPIAIPNRPTPEHIAGLFPLYDMAPRQDQYLGPDRENPWGYRRRRCGCAVGVLLVEAAGGSMEEAMGQSDSHGGTVAALARLANLPRPYVEGIDDGFTIGPEDIDMEEPTFDDPQDDALYLAGVADGYGAFDLVFPDRA